jgi:hypothetical protein
VPITSSILRVVDGKTFTFSTFSKVGGGKRVPPSVFVSRKSQGNF